MIIKRCHGALIARSDRRHQRQVGLIALGSALVTPIFILLKYVSEWVLDCQALAWHSPPWPNENSSLDR